MEAQAIEVTHAGDAPAVQIGFGDCPK